jgi:hypothetical protein
MASPLLEYANARIKIDVASGIQKDANGRFVPSGTVSNLIVCYLKRTQYTGVSSGSRKIPLPAELNGEMLPGASGDQFYYRGYALQKVILEDGDDWLGDLTGLTKVDVTQNQDFLVPETKVEFKFGAQPLMVGTIQRSTGQFGGLGIDELIYPELGVELQISGAEVL